jgi:hypothetical protein
MRIVSGEKSKPAGTKLARANDTKTKKVGTSDEEKNGDSLARYKKIKTV